MCITTLVARLTSTYVGVWDIDHPEHGYRHVLAYQNAPQNLADAPNCMLLHVPSKTPLEPHCVVPTDKDPDFLSRMSQSIMPIPRGRAFGSRSVPNVVVEMGIYHIALLNSLDEQDVADCLATIPAHKQPKISQDFIQFYGETFPGFPLVLCCFNNQDSKKASPIMIHFDPLYPDVFMFPTLESHGKVPAVGKQVKFHQTIVTGSYQLDKGGNGFREFNLRGISPELLPYLPRFGTAESIDSRMPNGDVLVEAGPIRSGGDARMRVGIITQ